MLFFKIVNKTLFVKLNYNKTSPSLIILRALIRWWRRRKSFLATLDFILHRVMPGLQFIFPADPALRRGLQRLVLMRMGGLGRRLRFDNNNGC